MPEFSLKTVNSASLSCARLDLVSFFVLFNRDNDRSTPAFDVIIVKKMIKAAPICRVCEVDFQINCMK